MVLTRNNRMGNWKLMMATTPLVVNSSKKKEYSEELVELNSLPINPRIHHGTIHMDRDIERHISEELMNTSLYPETPTPPEFGLELLPHQKRGLSWMLSVEDNSMPIIVKKDKKNIRIFGGILADKPGTGKSVLMIALMKLKPCISFFKADRDLTRSKATLLLCPRNIVDQWVKEFLRCDKTITILQIDTPGKLRAVTSLEIALADVVILPYYVLANPAYISECRHIEELNPPALTSFDDLSKYKGILTRFHFHRIVFDEVHEIYEQSRSKKEDYEFVPFMEKFHSNWRWGLTGTPPKEAKLFADVLNCISRADLKLTVQIRKLKSRIVRSNNPDLAIPALTQEIKWVDLSAEELAMYNLFRKCSTDSQLMACSHFNVNDVPINALNTAQGMTLDQVSNKLQEEHSRAILHMSNVELPKAEKEVPILQDKLEDLQQRLMVATEREAKIDIREKINKARMKLRKQNATLDRCYRDLPRLTDELKYFRNIISSLEKDQQSCPICLDEYVAGADTFVGLTPCGHAFCGDCIEKLGNGPCPSCRKIVYQREVMMIRPAPAAVNNFLCEIYGTKINQMVLYIAAQMSIDSTFKFIIFVQYTKLATLVTQALLQYKINAVNLAGTVSSRTGALNKFQKPEYPVLLMSSEQSVSGVNIISASHVLILHPFNLGTDAESVAAEFQGIARAHRLGQKRPVQVVRFVTRGTIEEKMTTKRIGNNHLA